MSGLDTGFSLAARHFRSRKITHIALAGAYRVNGAQKQVVGQPVAVFARRRFVAENAHTTILNKQLQVGPRGAPEAERRYFCAKEATLSRFKIFPKTGCPIWRAIGAIASKTGLVSASAGRSIPVSAIYYPAARHIGPLRTKSRDFGRPQRRPFGAIC